ncbi:MAG: type II secretion system protein [Clostridia bacterium]
MKKLQTKKSNTGITLITLVITIVVLTILAGVSINTVVGDDGIIQKAKEKAEATRRASAEEEMNRLVLEYQLAKSDENFEDFLQEKINEGRINGATDNGDGTVTISKRVDGKDYTITVKKPVAPTPSVKVGAIRVVSDSTGAGSSLGEASTRKGTTLYIMIESTISGGTTTVSPQVPYAVTENGTYKFTVTGTVNGTAYTKEVSVTVNQFKNSILEDINIKIGDSVNYTYDTASSSYTLESKYSGYSSNKTIAQTTGLTWKVLNVDKENDTVDIISTNPTSSTVIFANILGYNNGPYLMNEICKAQYSNKTLGVEARNINLLDMEKHLTPTGIKSRNEYNKGDSTYAKYGTTKTYTSNTKYPSLYANQKGAGPNVSTISQPDITKGNDPYEESKPIVPKNTTEPTNDSTYGTGSPLTVTQTYYNISINNTNYGTASSILANSTYFWVAARYVGTSSSTAIFGLRFARTDTYGGYMFFSGGDTDGINYALRPIVSLPSWLLTGEPTNGAWNLSK